MVLSPLLNHLEDTLNPIQPSSNLLIVPCNYFVMLTLEEKKAIRKRAIANEAQKRYYRRHPEQVEKNRVRNRENQRRIAREKWEELDFQVF